MVSLLGAVLLGGCTLGYEPAPTRVDATPNSVISHTASLSSTLVSDRTDPLVACTQAAPDAGFSQSQENEISLSLIELGTSTTDADEDAEQSAEIEFAGRTPAVLITRELFFRVCEFARNNQLTKQEATDLYHHTLDTVAKVWAIEAQNTTVSVTATTTTTVSETEGGALPQMQTDPTAATPPVPSDGTPAGQ